MRIVLDLEMTGPEPGWNEIIQIGAIFTDGQFNELGSFSTLVFPENKESFSMLSGEIHGITQYDLQDAPMVHDALELFENWILNCLREKSGVRNPTRADLRKCVICGQSIMYDINFLRHAYKQVKLDYPFSNTTLDLHNLSYFLFKILEKNKIAVPKSRSLNAVAGFFGFERESDEHNALEDARITGQCMKAVLSYTSKLKLDIED
jgi:DNA polymerase-3 subunit epsilon